MRGLVTGLALLLAVPAAASPQGASAASPSPPGASSCAGCHGGGGMPVLAGQPAAAIEAAMLDYKAGQRSPSVMDRIARGFTGEEIQAIATWVSATR